jgi:hypothetical protein
MYEEMLTSRSSMHRERSAKAVAAVLSSSRLVRLPSHQSHLDDLVDSQHALEDHPRALRHRTDFSDTICRALLRFLLQLFRTTKLTPVFSLDHHHIPSPPSPLLTHRPSLPLSFPYRLVSIRYSPGQYSSSFLTPPSFGPVVLSSVPICASSGLLMCLRMVRCTLKRTKLEEICFCSCLGRAGNGGRGSLARNEMMWTSVGLGINY